MGIRKKICTGTCIAAICAAITLCGCAKDMKEAKTPDSPQKAGIKKDQKTDRHRYDRQIHVSAEGDDTTGDGSKDQPYATIQAAVDAVQPGTQVIIHQGEYEPFEVSAAAGGTEEKPVLIRAADDEKVVIKAQETGIHIVNAEHITIEGMEVEGGSHGIYYESTRERGGEPLDEIAIVNCCVHGVRGTHGICVYARNDLAPVTHLTMAGCEVYDCACGDSESTVFNGNIDGFEICDNIIHENNNIGIDMIGFEGTAKHPDGEGDNPYEVDFARNGTCHDNIVYGISAQGNDAYLEEGEYDLCADGIYVDGGQNIEIYNNFIFDCDIGLEVATEHSPDDNELFRVSGVNVHDNVIADCTGWCGICFGGYDQDLGFTEDCVFRNNTLIDNDTQIGVQRSRDNEIAGNLLAGGAAAVEFNGDIRKEDVESNHFKDNAAAQIEDTDSWSDEYGRMTEKSSEIVEGFTSRLEGIGSSFVPDDEAVRLYQKWRNNG